MLLLRNYDYLHPSYNHCSFLMIFPCYILNCMIDLTFNCARIPRSIRSGMMLSWKKRFVLLIKNFYLKNELFFSWRCRFLVSFKLSTINTFSNDMVHQKKAEWLLVTVISFIQFALYFLVKSRENLKLQ